MSHRVFLTLEPRVLCSVRPSRYCLADGDAVVRVPLEKVPLGSYAALSLFLFTEAPSLVLISQD